DRPRRYILPAETSHAIEAVTDHADAVDHEDPRLGAEVPLLHRRGEAVHAAGLPDLLVHERHTIAPGGNQRADDVEHRSAHAAGAVFRRREHDQLRATLTNRVRDSRLMEPRIRRLARIDQAQIAHATGDGDAAARARRAGEP